MLEIRNRVGWAMGLACMFTLPQQNARAQCTVPTASQWRKVDLSTTLNHPDAMSIVSDGRVFVSEMWSGEIKLYTPNSGVTSVLTIGIYNDGVENGLLGVAADPNFATNPWVYVLWSKKLPGATYTASEGGISPHEHMLTRYTLSGGRLGSPKDILRIPRLTKRHAAGALTFNRITGDLYISTGDDTYPGADQTKWGGRQEGTESHSSLRTSANTNDLRGKILRIRPLPFPDSQTPEIGVDKTYAIPAGNLFTPGTAKTLPEIYTMGHRNPYKIRVDEHSGYALIGEVGPDADATDPAKGSRGHEEFNLIPNKAGNYGWPFAVANNLMYTAIAGEAYAVGTTFVANNLRNISSRNTGIEQLPPATPALGWYSTVTTTNTVMRPFEVGGGETAIGGPMYRYDKQSAGSTVKLPAFFHGKFIVAEWSRNRMWALELNPDNTLAKVTDIRTAAKPIDLDIGPQGELYVLEYATNDGSYEGPNNSGKLYKLEYTGTHYEASTCPHYVPSAIHAPAASRPGALGAGHRLVNLSLTRQVAAPAGKRTGILYGLDGGRIWAGQVRDGKLVFPDRLDSNLGFLQFE